MDKNTLTGLVLIGLILVVFSIYTKNSVETENENNNAISQVDNTGTSEVGTQEIQSSSSNQSLPVASDDSTVIQRSQTAQKIEKGELITLENEKLIITFDTKGGIVSEVKLKQYKSYNDFIHQQDNSLKLFGQNDHSNKLVYEYLGKTYHSTDNVWKIEKKSSEEIIFYLPLDKGKILQKYTLKDGQYDIDYSIEFKEVEGIAKNDVFLIWDNSFLKTERLLSEQRRVSTIYFNEKEEGVDYLSESSDDYLEVENDVLWLAYKQSYFSSILKPSTPFEKNRSNFKITTFDEGSEYESTHLKNYYSKLKLEIINDRIDFNWYFGPNDFETLSSYGESYDDILNLGWGLFRWINIYAVQPIFKWILTSGVSAGIAILLLTVILKILLMPVQWKMFVSSIKMRILRPEIQKLNDKYPKKEDAMKKQMEMMSLYRDTGSSPLAGCLPMLIQMPILFAVFRFFPASFDLRQEGFLWAEDLSSYDSILDFGFKIPLYGDHISLFTLLMALTTLMYTFMNSGNMQQPTQPGMPNMKVIMYIFPIMMIFFFNDYSSGLSYYYFISTLLSIVIMLAIKYLIVDEDKLKLKMAERQEKSKDAPKKKSKLQERLEEMQKKQQEMLKNRKR